LAAIGREEARSQAGTRVICRWLAMICTTISKQVGPSPLLQGLQLVGNGLGIEAARCVQLCLQPLAGGLHAQRRAAVGDIGGRTSHRHRDTRPWMPGFAVNHLHQPYGYQRNTPE